VGKNALAGAVLGLGFMAAMSATADVIVGTPADPDIGNCFPWGCPYNAEYQQDYASSDFSGPITITELEFYNTQSNSMSTKLPTGSWTISLSTSSADPGSIGGNFAANLGGDNTVVFSSNIAQAWAFGDTLHIILSTPFSYDPALGSLLMDVVSLSNVDLNTYFDTNGSNNPGTLFTRVSCPGGIACADGDVNRGYGLVTGFSTGRTPIPEPGTLALLASALVSLVGATRRRR
jgi:PEP-CTERM motif